ncbi:MAG: cyclic nucleotide-binding domain-containing protein, partial [Acidobacteria bacterium]|nr:cyclic nucleotide-binding domain-containing protein [Acidobacteriota bacterium]
EADLAAFFGHFYAFTGAATLLVQFLLTPFLLARFGLLAGLLALPLFIGAGSLAVLLQPGVASAVIGKFADQSLKFTVNNSSLELLWLPVPTARRKAVRPLIGGAIKALAECAAGLSVFALVGITGLRYLSLIPLAVFAVWALTVVRLRSLYVKSLSAAIEKRQLDDEGLAIDVHDPAFTKLIEHSLRSGDELQSLAALEMIQGLPASQWSGGLEFCFRNGSEYLRRRVLELAAVDADALSDEQVLAALRQEELVALEAIRTAATRQVPGAEEELAEMMRGGPPQLRAASAASLLSVPHLAAEAKQVLKAMVESARPEECAAALSHLNDDVDLLPPERVRALLGSEAPAVREAALSAVRHRRDTAALEAAVSCFDEPRLAPAAQAALQALMDNHTRPRFETAWRKEPSGSRRKLGILQALAMEGSEAAMEVLVEAIDPSDLEASLLVLRSLIVRSNRAPLPPAVLERVKSTAPALLRSAYALNRLLSLVDHEEVNTLLRRDLADRMAQTIPVVLGVETLGSPHRARADAALIAAEADATKLPLLLELLDNVLAAEKRASVLPLIEPLPIKERDSTGARLFPDLPQQLEPELKRLAESERDWLSAIAIDHAWRTGRQHLFEQLDWGRLPNYPLTNEVRATFERRLRTMYSTLEKTLLLKSVSLFADIPAEKLAKVSLIAEETRMAAGQAVMREGEFGDSLFIVADGSVVVRKGGRDLAALKKGDCVGEMALLDHAPRSADVVVEQDATLLRIAREDFNEVAGANPEIFQAIVRLLARRLREANEKLASQARGA